MSVSEPRDGALADLAGNLRRWLAGDGCRSDDGAYYAWVDAADGSPSYPYPEITGYALTWLASHADATPEELAAGGAAGRWLLDRFARGDWSARTGKDDGASLVFDLAMTATGLLTFGRRTGNEAFVAQGREIVDLIVAQQQREGKLTSLSDRSPVRVAARAAWSTEGYAHLVKVAQCLLLGAEEGCDGAAASAEAVISYAATIQEDDGRFVTHEADGVTMLHPHLYAAEGLYVYGTCRGDADALARARAATIWAWKQQHESGGLPRFAQSSAAAPAQADLTAQAVRMALVLETEPAGLDRALGWLAAISRQSAAGTAIPYQPEAVPVHLNTWVTLFSAQAVELAVLGSPTLSWRHLV